MRENTDQNISKYGNTSHAVLSFILGWLSIIGIFNTILYYTTFYKSELCNILVKESSKFDDCNIGINAWFYYNFAEVKKPLPLEKYKKLELYAPGDIGHIRQDNRDKFQNCTCLEMWWLL